MDTLPAEIFMYIIDLSCNDDFNNANKIRGTCTRFNDTIKYLFKFNVLKTHLSCRKTATTVRSLKKIILMEMLEKLICLQPVVSCTKNNNILNDTLVIDFRLSLSNIYISVSYDTCNDSIFAASCDNNMSYKYYTLDEFYEYMKGKKISVCDEIYRILLDIRHINNCYYKC